MGNTGRSGSSWDARYRADSVVRPPRMYKPILDAILANTSDKPVKIKCPVNNQPRVIKAVRKLKAEQNTLRRNVDAVGFGRLIVRCEGEFIYFSIAFNGDQI